MAVLALVDGGYRRQDDAETGGKSVALNWSVDDMVRIASYGGGFSVSANKVSADDMVRICSYAAGKGRITITESAALSIDDAIRIASYGKGSAYFVS